MKLSVSVERILKGIFSDSVSFSDDEYLPSIAFEPRRALNKEEVLSSVRYRRPTSPHWLAGIAAFGPYEQALITDLLHGPHNVCIFQGGTGSGKSSTLLRLFDRSDRLFARLTRQLPNFPCDGFVSMMDVQQYSEKYGHYDKSATPYDVWTDSLLNDLIDLLRTDLKNVIRNNVTGVVELYERLDSDGVAALGVNSATSAFSVAIDQLQSIFRGLRRSAQPSWRELPDALKYDLLLEEISIHKDAQIKFLIHILPYCLLSRQLKAVGARYMIIFDNLDRIPIEVQNRVYRLLDVIFRDRHLVSCGIRIVLSMRLSTASDPKAAFRDFDIIPHAAPDPAEVVFYRLTRFLLSAEDNSEFKRLVDRDQREVIARVFSLWDYLREKDSKFHRILGARSGTNNRLASQISLDWLLHEDSFASQNEIDSTTAYGAIVDIKKDSYRHVCVSAGLPIVAGVKAELVDCHTSNNDVDFSGKGVSRYACDLCKIVFEVLQDTGFLSRQVERVSPRQITGGFASRELLARGTLAEFHDHPYVFRAIVQLLKSLNDSEDFDSALIRELIRSVCTQTEAMIPDKLRDYCEKNELTCEEVVAKKIVGMCKVVAKSLELSDNQKTDVLTSIDLEPRERGGFDHMKVNTTRSYHEACRSLLIAGADDVLACPVNLFTVDGITLEPALLRILYLVNDFGTSHPPHHPLTTRRLIDDFDRHGLLNVLEPSLEKLCAMSSRLVYSGSIESVDNAHDILGVRDAFMRLSWAGKEYLDFLCCEPVYLQWALSTIGMKTQELQFPEERFSMILEELQGLVDSEFMMLKDAYDSINASSSDRQRTFGVLELTCQSASGDVFFRSMGNFVRDIRRSYILQKRKRSNPDSQRKEILLAHASLLDRWLSLGDQFLREHGELFGHENARWRKELDEWTSFVDRRRIDEVTT